MTRHEALGQTVGVPHRIFAGPFEALEARLLTEIVERQRGDPLAPVSVVVGSNILAAYLKSRLAASGRAAANLRFYTFLDLANRLASGSGPQPKPPLPPLGASWILQGLLEDVPPRPFGEVSDLAGFRAALLDTFRDLRDAGISAEDFERGVRGSLDETPERREHLLGLAELYSRFRARTAPFSDVDDLFRRASAAAPGAAGLVGSSFTIVYGVYDITGQQADLLRALEGALELAYFVPHVEDGSAEFARPFLEARAAALGASIERLGPPRAKSTSLAALADRLFAPAAPRRRPVRPRRSRAPRHA